MPGEMPRVLAPEEIPPPLAERAANVHPGVYVASWRGRIYLLVSAGEQKTAGYHLRLTGPPAEQLSGGKAEVELVGPERGAMVAQVLTYPFLVIDAGQGPVRLREAYLLRAGRRQTLPILSWGEVAP